MANNLIMSDANEPDKIDDLGDDIANIEDISNEIAEPVAEDDVDVTEVAEGEESNEALAGRGGSQDWAQLIQRGCQASRGCPSRGGQTSRGCRCPSRGGETSRGGPTSGRHTSG